jgi:hypothetical protein
VGAEKWQLCEKPPIASLASHSLTPTSKGGKDATKTSSSAAVLFTTLVPVFIVAAAQLLGFFILRRTNRHIYAPKTILTTLDEVYVLPSHV